jgi:hypothetical protein
LSTANGNTIDASAKVLTDDFAPVESLKAIENHNRKWPDLTATGTTAPGAPVTGTPSASAPATSGK